MRIHFLHDAVPVLIAPAGRQADAELLEASDIPISIHGVGCNWLVRNHFPKAGEVAPGHYHYHDHLMLLTAGSVEIIVNGLRTRYAADHIIIIPKETRHQVRALQDNTTIWCIAALRDGETGEIVGPDDRPMQFQPLTDELATALGELNAAIDPAASTT